MAFIAIERVTGLVGTLFVVALAAVGGWALVATYALETPAELETDGLVAPTIATLGLTICVVAVLVGLGARSRRWLANPYW